VLINFFTQIFYLDIPVSFRITKPYKAFPCHVETNNCTFSNCWMSLMASSIGLFLGCDQKQYHIVYTARFCNTQLVTQSAVSSEIFAWKVEKYVFVSLMIAPNGSGNSWPRKLIHKLP
jgi:hypothetical protein